MKNQKITEEQHDMLLEELMRQEMLFSENGKFIPTDSYYRDVGLLSLLIRRINKRIDKDQEGSTDSGIQYRFIETPDYADDECKNDA